MLRTTASVWTSNFHVAGPVTAGIVFSVVNIVLVYSDQIQKLTDLGPRNQASVIFACCIQQSDKA